MMQEDDDGVGGGKDDDNDNKGDGGNRVDDVFHNRIENIAYQSILTNQFGENSIAMFLSPFDIL